MQDQKELGRIELDESTDIVVSVGTFKGKERVDIRKWIKTQRYTGFSTQGIAIPKDKWKEAKKILDKVE